MSNSYRAVKLIEYAVEHGYTPEQTARLLEKFDLLAPDLPAPDTSLPSGEREWDVGDGYVNLDDGEILVSYDERDEDTYLTESAPEPGEIRITDTGQGRAVAYNILAACDMKDAHAD